MCVWGSAGGGKGLRGRVRARGAGCGCGVGVGKGEGAGQGARGSVLPVRVHCTGPRLRHLCVLTRACWLILAPYAPCGWAARCARRLQRACHAV